MVLKNIILPAYVEKTVKRTFVCPFCETAQDVTLEVTLGMAVVECKAEDCGQLIMAMQTRKHGWVYHAVFPMSGEVKIDASKS
jgi:transcription elongation factor Elf1